MLKPAAWFAAFAIFLGGSVEAFANELSGDESDICKPKDFGELFFEDYFPEGNSWVNGSPVTISWSIASSSIAGEPVVKELTTPEITALQESFKAWEEESDLISFSQVNSENEAQLLIGYTNFNNVPIDAAGYWTAQWRDSKRYAATIRLNSNKESLKSLSVFKQAALHEIGNVLGLGDIRPSLGFNSVMNDPWIVNYPAPTRFDGVLLRQLTGEDLCPVPATDEAVSPSNDSLSSNDQLSQSSQKLNAGSFKGYVALYAKGYEGRKLSAKVGNDWVIVDSIESDFERYVEFTGAGYEINVRMFIDREFVFSKILITK